MTLEDFFTLTEMKDGLMALARVEELVSVMREEKDSVVTNVGEAARQWCTVASTLAATETKDILDHFIQLGGIYFLDRWLQEAQRCRSDTSDSSLEESIIALLGALEKLPIDNERSISSGIGGTVKDLSNDKNTVIQERASALSNSWKKKRDKVSEKHNVEKNGGFNDNGVISAKTKVPKESGCLEHSVVSSTVNGGANVVDNVATSGVEGRCSRSSENLQMESIKEEKVANSSDGNTLQKASDCIGKEDGLQSNARDSSTLTVSCQEDHASTDDQRTSIGASMSVDAMEGNNEGKLLDVPEPKTSSSGQKEADMKISSQDRFGKMDVSVSSEHISSSMDPANVQHSSPQATVRSCDGKVSDSCLDKSQPDDLDGSTLACKPNSGAVDCGGQHTSTRNTLELEITDQNAGCCVNTLQDSPNTGSSLRKPDDLKTSFSRKENIGAINDRKERSGDPILKAEGGNKSATCGEVLKSVMGTKARDKNHKVDIRRSDMELDYGADNALEVAWQVAKDVEREVADYREDRCSSSEKRSGGVGQPSSPNSINDEQEQPLTGDHNEVRNGHINCGTISPKGKDYLINAENMDKHKDFLPDPDSSLVTEGAQEPADNTDRSMCDFDLNKEVFSEEMDHPMTSTSAPITVVSASRAAAPGLPMVPLHFEGKLGWKGSAATSAFRPASHCRISDGEKTSFEGSVQNSKQRQVFCDIDLNVAGGDNDGVIDPVLSKHVPASSDLHSGESSVEVSSRIAERLKLDLNRAGDNEETPSDWKMEGGFHQYPRNDHHSPSPASSSSSRAPSMRNIDLNDNPSFFDYCNDQRPNHGRASTLDINTCEGIKLDDPAISIFGTRLEINKKEPVLQTRSFLPNGQGQESLMGANFARSGGGVGSRHAMSYSTSPPMFGYNGHTAGPSMSLSPAAMYGPSSFPYMVDSRGSPVLPQIMGSPVGIQPSYSRPPFVMGMNSPLSGLNGVGAMHPNLDLNSGMTLMETETREPPGLRHLYIQGSGMPMEDHTRSASQPMSSGMAMKRKEPDGGGWDLYPVGYKQKAPWQ